MAEYSVSHETDFWEHWWWGLGCCHKWWLNPPACTHPNSWRCHDTEVSAETLESREFPTRDKILYSTCYPQIYCIATVGALQSRIGNEVTGINVCPARLPTELNMSSFSGIMLPSCKLISTQTWMTEQQDLIWFQKRLLWLWVNTNVTISIIFSRTLNTNLCLGFSFQFFFPVLTYPLVSPTSRRPDLRLFGWDMPRFWGSMPLGARSRDRWLHGTMESVVGICGFKGWMLWSIPCWMLVDDGWWISGRNCLVSNSSHLGWLLKNCHRFVGGCRGVETTKQKMIWGRKDFPLWSSLLWEAGISRMYSDKTMQWGY